MPVLGCIVRRFYNEPKKTRSIPKVTDENMNVDRKKEKLDRKKEKPHGLRTVVRRELCSTPEYFSGPCAVSKTLSS